jgi:murein L,D-transpeptidase YcbB/YkuD
LIGTDGAIIAPGGVDWSARPFPYRLRQRPGPANALGQLRFDMPNAFAIYLHDTPNRALFTRSTRALSHGCIRVETPNDLARDVLNSPEWTLPALEGAIASGASQTIAVPDPLPVYLIYLTASESGDGQIAYAEDIYRRDAAVVAALDGPDAALVRRPASRPLTCSG